MEIVIGKLNAFKLSLKAWNKEVFGNLDHNIEATSATLVDIQKWYDKYSFFQELFHLKSYAHANIDRLLHQQDTILREKIRLKWLKGDDRNITFFHSLLK